MFRHDIIYDLIIFQLVLLAVVLSNTWALRRARRHAPPASWPRVSILVPARNEERNIERCVRSLLAQDYPDFELLVLDDESTDRTAHLLAAIDEFDERLTVLSGRPLPAGWLGKNWACAQLAARANGHFLFFTDADTYHQPHTLRALVSAMERERADLLCGFPRQEVHTRGEKIIVPFFSWAAYCFTPLLLAYRLKLPALSTAVGQALLFRRDAYEGIGGHETVRASIVEDIELARQIIGRGYRWRMARLTDLISCRMYRGGREAAAALSRNLFAAFGFRVLPYLFAWGWLFVLFLKPFIDLGLHALGVSPGVPIGAVVAAVALGLLVWLAPYGELGMPRGPALFYPATLLIMEGVALRSFWYALSGRLTWKGRAIVRPRLRLF